MPQKAPLAATGRFNRGSEPRYTTRGKSSARRLEELGNGVGNGRALHAFALGVVVVAAGLHAAPVARGVILAAVVRDDGIQVEDGNVKALAEEAEDMVGRELW